MTNEEIIRRMEYVHEQFKKLKKKAHIMNVKRQISQKTKELYNQSKKG